MKWFIVTMALLIAIKLLSLAQTKVKNELQMTKEYHAQAVQLKRIADAVEARR